MGRGAKRDLTLALAGLLVAGHAGLLAWIAWTRNIDSDEGTYLMASRLAAAGYSVYTDFFYAQMPLLPYLYGTWMNVVGFGFVRGRLLSVLLAGLAAAALAWHLSQRSEDRRAAGICVALYAFNGMALSWFATVKTLAAPISFLTLWFVFSAAWARRPEKRWLLACAGICLGLAGSLKLFYLGLCPVALGWIAAHGRLGTGGGGRTARDGLAFALGCGVVTLFPLYFLVKDPQAFLFNNLGYHLVRSSDTWLGSLLQKGQVLHQLLSSLQMALLLIGGIGGMATLLVSARRRWRDADAGDALAAVTVVALGVIFVLPAPTLKQYYVGLVPFLAVLSRPVVELMLREGSLGSRALVAGGIALYSVVGIPDALVEVRTVGSHAGQWERARIVAVGRVVAGLTKPGDKVLTWWPGYAFAADRDPWPGLESEWGFVTSRKISTYLSEASRRRYRIGGPEDIRRALERREAPVVVVGARACYMAGGEEEFMRVRDLIIENYSVRDVVGGAMILVPRSGDARAESATATARWRSLAVSCGWSRD